MKVYKSLFAATFLAAGGAWAQGVKTGFQLTISEPQGDLAATDQLNMKTGYGAGFSILVPLQNGVALVPRLDYVGYSRTQTVGSIDYDTKVSTWVGALDLEYFTSGKTNQGLYLAAGIGYGTGKFEMSHSSQSVSASASAFNIAAGFGYVFNNTVSAELRYTSAKYEPEFNGLKLSASCPALNASLIFRF